MVWISGHSQLPILLEDHPGLMTLDGVVQAVTETPADHQHTQF